MNQLSKPKFNPEINLGNILTMIVLVVTLLATYFEDRELVKQVEARQTNLENRVIRFEDTVENTYVRKDVFQEIEKKLDILIRQNNR